MVPWSIMFEKTLCQTMLIQSLHYSTSHNLAWIFLCVAHLEPWKRLIGGAVSLLTLNLYSVLKEGHPGQFPFFQRVFFLDEGKVMYRFVLFHQSSTVGP